MATVPGKLIVLSGPAGSGKSTLIARALGPGDLPVRLSVSATTRSPRPGEVDGIHYHFWNLPQFEQVVKAGEFLEWEDLFGNRYGTLKREVDPHLAAGTSVLLEIDVSGAQRVRAARPDTLLVFVRASSMEEYERRLRARGTESPASLERRLNRIHEELAIAPTYHLQIVNDNLDRAVEEFRRLLQSQGGSPRAG